MPRLVTVEPLIALSAMYLASYGVILPQFIYQRLLAEAADNGTDVANISAIGAPPQPSCINSTTPPSGGGGNNSSSGDAAISAETSMWMLYLNLAEFFSSIFVTLPLSSWGDTAGRRPPLLCAFAGFLLENLIIVITLHYRLPLRLLLAAAFAHGCGGGFTGVLASAFAYVADVSSPARRTLRIAVGESALGVGSTVGSLYTGYLVAAYGFTAPMLVALGINCTSIFYILFVLEESRPAPGLGEINNNEDDDDDGENDKLITPATNTTTRRRRPTLASKLCREQPLADMVRSLKRDGNDNRLVAPLLVAILLQCVFLAGNGAVATIYKESSPFCWSPTLIGWVSSLSSLSFFVSLLTIRLLRDRIGDVALVYLSVLSSCALLLFEAFSTATWMLIAGTCAGLWASTLVTVARSIISTSVHPADQGSYFALVALVENVGYISGAVIFNDVYALTVAQHRQFVFFVGLFIELILFVILTIAFRLNKSRRTRRSEYEEITGGVEEEAAVN